VPDSYMRILEYEECYVKMFLREELVPRVLVNGRAKRGSNS